MLSTRLGKDAAMKKQVKDIKGTPVDEPSDTGDATDACDASEETPPKK